MNGIHIFAPRGHYIGQVRKAGHKLWETATAEFESAEDALFVLATKMAGMKRGSILIVDDSGYYEPNLVMEISRK
jgi:hypothetical protein